MNKQCYWVECVPGGRWCRKHSSVYLQHLRESSHPETENWCSQSCRLPKRGTLKEKLLKIHSPNPQQCPSHPNHSIMVNNSQPDSHRTKVKSKQQKGTGKARLMYFEAMCLGCHAIGLDHGDEDGDVAQRTALTASYTDTQSIGGTLRKRESHCWRCTKNETPEYYIQKRSELNDLTRVISTVRMPGSVPGGIKCQKPTFEWQPFKSFKCLNKNV